MVAVDTVGRTAETLHVFAVVAWRTATHAPVLQQEVVGLAAQTKGSVGVTGRALGSARAARATLGETSANENRQEGNVAKLITAFIFLSNQ